MFALLSFAGLVRLGAGLCILDWTKVPVGSPDELGETVRGQCAGGARLLRGGLRAIAIGVGRRRYNVEILVHRKEWEE